MGSRTRTTIWTLAGVLAIIFALEITPTPRTIDDAIVKVDIGRGWGSGVAITPDTVLTAAHVIPEIDPATPEQTITITIKRPGVSLPATVVWVDRKLDVALLHVPGAHLQTRDLACRPTVLGEPVTIVGYPVLGGGFDADSTILTKGYVASRLLEQQDRDWPEMVVLDARTGRGASGTAVLDAKGKIIGTFVGMFGYEVVGPPRGQSASRQLIKKFVPEGFSIMVPSTTLCRLLGA